MSLRELRGLGVATAGVNGIIAAHPGRRSLRNHSNSPIHDAAIPAPADQAGRKRIADEDAGDPATKKRKDSGLDVLEDPVAATQGPDVGTFYAAAISSSPPALSQESSYVPSQQSDSQHMSDSPTQATTVSFQSSVSPAQSTTKLLGGVESRTLAAPPQAPTDFAYGAIVTNPLIPTATPNSIPVAGGGVTTAENTVSMDTDEVLSRNGSLQDYALISERLQQITNAKAKPDPVGEPPVWAQRRQAMCETLLYARNYQSCAYTLNGISHSCTFDLASGPRAREFMDADVIIATAGGGLTKEKFDDAMTREHDQPVTGVIQALRNNTQFENAVVIICGERNVNSPSKMPHPYNVLGWFKPTHVWSEKIGGKRVFRFRFERIVVEDVSWWAPQGVTNPAPLGSLPTPIVRTCSECQRSSPQIYLQGWMCLNDGNEICQNFWLLNGQEPNDNLNFDPRFLKQKTHWETDGEPHSLAPSPMPVELGRIQGQGVSWEAWRGIVCPHCGSCNSREHWLAWVCSNPNCGAKYTIPATPLPLAALQDLQHPISDGFAFNRDLLNHSFDGMQHRVQNIEGCRTNVFTIPGAKGCIVHILANKSMNAVPGGADYMWDRLQNVDIGLRRRLMKSAIIRGGFLTNHFAANFGVQYNYVAMVDSKPIEDADPVISTARSLMDRISKRVTSEFAPGMHVEFNEVLALGYFEKQMIKYHDDGETGLGPVIATLSIGQPAIMTLRMKAKYYNGSSKNGCYVDAAPLPGCRDHAIRKEAHEQLNTIPDPAQRRARMAELPKELKLKKTGVAPDAVSMHLAHGDIVIMAGEEIQKYFEHQVKPTGNLRFALTCRYIDPASVGLASVHDHAHDHDDGGVESVENDG